MNDDGCHIVWRTLAEACLDEFVAGVVGVVGGEENFGNFALIDVTAQAIRTQQPPVTGLGIKNVGVDFWLDINIPQHPHQHTATGVNSGFLRGDSPAVNQPLNEGVISRNLFEEPFTQPINPGVTNVGDNNLVAHTDHCTKRCPHSGEFGVVGHRPGEFFSCPKNSPIDFLAGFFDTAVWSIEPHQVSNRQRTGDVTTGVTAHPVGDDKQMVANRPGVLVAGSNLAHMRGSRTENRC